MPGNTSPAVAQAPAVNIESIRAVFVWSLYQSQDGYGVVKYKSVDDGSTFVACGSGIPIVNDCSICLYGEWERSPKFGKQFKVKYFEMEMPNSEKGVISYLCSLKIRIGKKKAKAIYKEFGDTIWDILENDPYKLTKVRGVTSKTVDRLVEKMAETKILRHIIAAFHGIIPVDMQKAKDVHERFGDNALEIIKKHPYRLCSVSGFPYSAGAGNIGIDEFALQQGASPVDPERLIYGVHDAMEKQTTRGNVCVPMDLLVESTKKIINAKKHNIPDDFITETIRHEFKKSRLKGSQTENGMCFYLPSLMEQEKVIANEVANRLKRESCVAEIEPLLEQYQAETGMTLAPQQADAVRMVFKNSLSIITGGPGTGKTATTKAVLRVNELVYGNMAAPVLLAPTGKAARRMKESTGYEAQTIHSAIGYTGVEGTEDEATSTIEGNLVVVDESSMMDQMIASMLLQGLPPKARVVFVGDPDQLPSVGAGDVLRDMINSEVVPKTKLSVIYRQGADSPIITNAHKINNGDTNLVYPKEFQFYPRTNPEDIFRGAVNFFLRCVKWYGLDEVVLLNPYRTAGLLCVNKFNAELHDRCNPLKPGEPTIKAHGIEFRKGDKIMQTKNTEAAKNGDVGYVMDICKRPSKDDPTEYEDIAMVEFNGDGVQYAYTEEDLKNVELGYCMTIHKSQGSQYKVVIMIMSNEHKASLKRNLLYTGITRAEKYVAIIGEQSAIEKAILTADADKRYTMLKERLRAAIAS